MDEQFGFTISGEITLPSGETCTGWLNVNAENGSAFLDPYAPVANGILFSSIRETVEYFNKHRDEILTNKTVDPNTLRLAVVGASIIGEL